LGWARFLKKETVAFDLARFKAENPEIYSKYIKKTVAWRVSQSAKADVFPLNSTDARAELLSSIRWHGRSSK